MAKRAPSPATQGNALTGRLLTPIGSVDVDGRRSADQTDKSGEFAVFGQLTSCQNKT